MQEEALKQAFVSALPDRLADIENIYDEWGEHGISPDELKLMHRLSHNLAGSGGIYGYEKLAISARNVEKLLRPLMAMPESEWDEARSEVESALSLVREQVAQVCGAAK